MGVRLFPKLFAIISGCLLLAYLVLVLLPATPTVLLPAYVAGCIGLTWLVSLLFARGYISRNGLWNLGVASLAALITLVSADAVYMAYSGGDAAVRDAANTEQARMTDRHLDQGRLLPPVYYPTGDNFYVFKPGIAMRGTGYGDFYHAGLLQSQRLVQELLEPRYLEYTIGDHGFRDSKPLDGAGIYALGDSFAFGHGVSDGEAWTRRLEGLQGKPVFNLGVPGTSPAQHVRLMRHLLGQSPAPGVQHLLWMIYEGNDLTDDYSAGRPFDEHPENSFRDSTAGRVLAIPSRLLKQLRSRSVIAQIVDGRRVFAGSADTGVDRLQFDGVKTPHPVYISPRHGPKMFHAYYIDAADRDRAYYERHENRARLERALQDMSELGELHRFRITVVIAPTAASLHAPDFEGLAIPESGAPVVALARDLASEAGFDVIDLYSEMQDDARDRLLYWRDDSHWNIAGNRVVARIVHDALLSAERR